MNIVKTISTSIRENVRWIKVLRKGTSDIQESRQVSPHGIDSNPVKDLIAIYAPTFQTGKPVIIGYINKNQISDVGEFRCFSTNEHGNLSTYVHLKNNGHMEIGGSSDHMVRFSKLESAFNELLNDHNSLVTSYNSHMHPTAPTGPPSLPTILGSPSVADISLAKINEIKTI